MPATHLATRPLKPPARAFTLIELLVVVGIIAHSLALLSDAAHMLADAGALALSLVVIQFVQRPGGETLTYGRRRDEVLSGQANSAVLLVLGVLVTYEAIWRLIMPPDVAGVHCSTIKLDCRACAGPCTKAR